jgi:hypothetical protein
MKCTVTLIWDEEAHVWYTQTDDIPGLALSAPTYDGLVSVVSQVAPELLEENKGYTGLIYLIFESVRIDKVSA